MKTFPYWAEAGQVKTYWTVRVDITDKRPASAAVMTGTEAECRATARLLNAMARGKSPEAALGLLEGRGP